MSSECVDWDRDECESDFSFGFQNKIYFMKVAKKAARKMRLMNEACMFRQSFVKITKEVGSNAGDVGCEAYMR